MKWLCLIATVWVLVLSTTPCCEDGCNDDPITEQTQQQEDEACADCSPFLLCGSCTGFTFTNVFFTFQLPVSETYGVFTPITEASVTDCLIKVWQPPKLV